MVNYDSGDAKIKIAKIKINSIFVKICTCEKICPLYGIVHTCGVVEKVFGFVYHCFSQQCIQTYAYSVHTTGLIITHFIRTAIMSGQFNNARTWSVIHQEVLK